MSNLNEWEGYELCHIDCPICRIDPLDRHNLLSGPSARLVQTVESTLQLADPVDMTLRLAHHVHLTP